jgi:hypothetical protein
MSSFIYLCLRSVHSLHSFRFGGRCSCLTSRPPFTTLRSVHFTHLSTPQHKWLLHSTPQIHAVIPFRLTAVIHAQRIHTQQPVKLHFIPQPIVPLQSVATYAPFQRLPMVYFSHCGVSTPLSA